MTTMLDGRPAGLTANSFSALSLDPPLVLWSISRNSRSAHVFQQADSFTVNVLAAGQTDLSQNFAGPKENKFEGVSWLPSGVGAPVLPGVAASIECERHECLDGGDHVIIVGRVRHYSRYDRQPLLYAQGRYAVAADHPSLQGSVRSGIEPGRGASDPAGALPLLSLLYRASNRVTVQFEEHRRAEGISIPQVRVMSGLYDEPAQTLDTLSARMYLGGQDSKDAVADLVDRDYVYYGEDTSLSLTGAGRILREAIAQRMSEFDKELLAGVSQADLAATRRVLCVLLEKKD